MLGIFASIAERARVRDKECQQSFRSAGHGDRVRSRVRRGWWASPAVKQSGHEQLSDRNMPETDISSCSSHVKTPAPLRHCTSSYEGSNADLAPACIFRGSLQCAPRDRHGNGALSDLVQGADPTVEMSELPFRYETF